MAFYLVEGRAPEVDYLDPKAMTAYISLTYDRYNQYLGKYFGTLITQTFYDEPSMHHADRMWTPGFNAAFQKRYGYSPMKYYPALWYDIGPQHRRRAQRPVRLPRHAVRRELHQAAERLVRRDTICNSAGTSTRKSRSTPRRSTAT